MYLPYYINTNPKASKQIEAEDPCGSPTYLQTFMAVVAETSSWYRRHHYHSPTGSLPMHITEEYPYTRRGGAGSG